MSINTLIEIEPTWPYSSNLELMIGWMETMSKDYLVPNEYIVNHDEDECERPYQTNQSMDIGVDIDTSSLR